MNDTKQQLGWCSLEQSKKLIEAGLDLNTADMTYTNESLHGVEYTSQFRVVPIKYNEYKENFDKVKSMLQTPCFWEIYPCWSLGRLIELMPEIAMLVYDSTGKIPSYFISIGPSESGEDIFLSEQYSTSIEAAVSTIIWLLENNHIKKGKTK